MPRLLTGSPWQQFKQKWQDCTNCSLCETRRNVVLCRGKLPCDVLFIGEAPGPSEDDLGEPFVGPAGHLLDDQIAEALDNAGNTELKLCFTNLVCCIPKNPDNNAKWSEPPKQTIEACDLRLKEFVSVCKPKLVVLVGDLSAKVLNDRYNEGFEKEKIIHPAALLRMRENDRAKYSLYYNRAVVLLENAFMEI